MVIHFVFESPNVSCIGRVPEKGSVHFASCAKNLSLRTLSSDLGALKSTKILHISVFQLFQARQYLRWSERLAHWVRSE
jgi:hypothetical protein